VTSQLVVAEGPEMLSRIKGTIAAIESTDPARAAGMRGLLKLLQKDEPLKIIDRHGTHVVHRDGIDAYRFRAALYGNLTDFKIRAEDNAMARLAHLYSASIAELELRKRAANDAAAQTLVAQLDQMKACERDIL
jgi:hypothetical protein